MIVTTAKIFSLNPCKSRLDNFLDLYPNFRGEMTEFLKLEGITHSDKCWVYFRMVSSDTAVAVAADIAESVLHLYEQQYHTDSRPRRAIEAARSKKLSKDELRVAAAYAADAASAAANAADAASAAVYVARAAAYAAYAAVYAASAATYAATYAADAAAYAAHAAANAAGNEGQQYRIMLKRLREEEKRGNS